VCRALQSQVLSLTWCVMTSGASQRGLLADKFELVSALPAVRDRLKSPTCIKTITWSCSNTSRP
jgi:hypothetical protein